MMIQIFGQIIFLLWKVVNQRKSPLTIYHIKNIDENFLNSVDVSPCDVSTFDKC